MQNVDVCRYTTSLHGSSKAGLMSTSQAVRWVAACLNSVVDCFKSRGKYEPHLALLKRLFQPILSSPKAHCTPTKPVGTWQMHPLAVAFPCLVWEHFGQFMSSAKLPIATRPLGRHLTKRIKLCGTSGVSEPNELPAREEKYWNAVMLQVSSTDRTNSACTIRVLISSSLSPGSYCLFLDCCTGLVSIAVH